MTISRRTAIQKARYKKKKERAIKTLASYKNSDGTQKENKIEKKVRELLDSMGLYYEQEKRFSYKGKTRIFDFYVTNGITGWACEIQGTYWHSQKYLEGEQKYATLTKIQKRNLRNDKFKNLMMKEMNIPILYLWEDEINSNIKEVERKIKGYVERYFSRYSVDIDN